MLIYLFVLPTGKPVMCLFIKQNVETIGILATGLKSQPWSLAKLRVEVKWKNTGIQIKSFPEVDIL